MPMEGALHWRVLKSQENSGPVCRKLSALPAALSSVNSSAVMRCFCVPYWQTTVSKIE